jgi:triacylglycerol lipase
MRRTHVEPKDSISSIRTRDYEEADVHILGEVLFAAELVLLHASPVYYGLGVPHGDGSAVILIPCVSLPGFLLDAVTPMVGANRIPTLLFFFSGIGFNTECPNLLIRRQLNSTIEKALTKSGQKVHLIGHSLGGIIARAIAARRPMHIASVTTLVAPFQGTVAHRSILFAAEAVRRRILARHGTRVLPDCYTGHCTCDFLKSLGCAMPASVLETAVYTEGDGVFDWHYCRTDRAESDFSVPGTHIGLAFNPSVYSIIAARLTLANSPKNRMKRRRVGPSPRNLASRAHSGNMADDRRKSLGP